MTLRQKYAALGSRLHPNQLGKPLVLDSRESVHPLQGNVYAVVDHPFQTVRIGLNNPSNWRDPMLLHINTKYCRAETAQSATLLKINFSKKTQEELEDVPQLEFQYKPTEPTSE